MAGSRQRRSTRASRRNSNLLEVTVICTLKESDESQVADFAKKCACLFSYG